MKIHVHTSVVGDQHTTGQNAELFLSGNYVTIDVEIDGKERRIRVSRDDIDDVLGTHQP